MSPTPPTRPHQTTTLETAEYREERGRTGPSRPLGRSLRVPVDNSPRHVDDGHWACELISGRARKTTADEPAPLNHSFVVPHPPPARSRAATGLSPESTSPNTPTDPLLHDPSPTARTRAPTAPEHAGIRHVDAPGPHASRLHLDSPARTGRRKRTLTQGGAP